MKWLKIIVFAVGSYYILKFLVRLYKARSSASSATKNQPSKNSNDIHPANKKSIINPQAGEYTDYEEVKD